MVESLISGKAVLVNIEDRTHVVNFKEWNITGDDIIHVYDHGGHFVYCITSPLFISRESVLFIVHDVTRIHPDDITRTTDALFQALHQYPANPMYIILTHIDLLNSDQVAQNSDFLRRKLLKFLDDEISNLNKLIIQKKSDVDCEDIVDDTNRLLQHFKDKRSNLPVFQVSSQNYSGMKEVKECLVKVAEEKRLDIPSSWIELYKQILGAKKIYLKMAEVFQLYRASSDQTAETSQGASHSEKDARVPLQYFADSNLCLHYEDHPSLKNYIFVDIEFLSTLFKALFHHDITSVIDYENDEKVQAHFHQGECELEVQRYQKEGLMGKKLLSFLWDHYKLSKDAKTTLIELMESFQLCYSVSKTDTLMFFPWFVQSQECPPHINGEHLMKLDKENASVHLQCQFYNRIPINIFEMVSVSLQKIATEEHHYIGERQAWHDGLEISFGSVTVILMRNEQNSTIDICLHGKIEDMPQVWRTMDTLLLKLQDILKPWQGVIRRFHFVCGHCMILRIACPHFWLPRQVFPKQGIQLPQFVKCPKKPDTSDIPAALVMNCFEGTYV